MLVTPRIYGFDPQISKIKNLGEFTIEFSPNGVNHC